MISKEKYKQISRHWEGRIYSKLDQQVIKLKYLERLRHLFKGKRVFEVGCNAGLFAYHIAKWCDSYVGVDSDKRYYEQALITRKFISNPNVEFFYGQPSDYVKKEEDAFDLFFASYIMYHLNNDQLKAVCKHILPFCNTVVIPNRTAKRKTIKNLYHFEDPELTVDFFAKQGFKCKIIWEKKRRFHIVIGERHVRFISTGS